MEHEINFKNWLLTEADAGTLYDIYRWVTALSANLGYLKNDLQNAHPTVPENIRKNASLVSAVLQATARSSDFISQSRGDMNWIAKNQKMVEDSLLTIVEPLKKLLPLIPPNMGKIAENGQKVLEKIAAAGIGVNQPQTGAAVNQPQTGSEPISIKKLEFDFRLKPGTLDIQMLSKTGMVSVRNRITGKVVSVKPDRKSIEAGIAQII